MGMSDQKSVLDRTGLRSLADIVKAAASEFGEDKAGRQAAALAYYTLFSIVPLLFVAVAVTAITLGPPVEDLPRDAEGNVDCNAVTESPLDTDSDRPLDRLVVQLDDVAGDAITDPVRILICQARDNATTSLSLGLLVAAFSASGIFLQVQGVLNWIFHVPDARVKGVVATIRRRLVALVSAMVLAILVLIPVLAVATVQFVLGLLPEALDWLRALLGFTVPLISLALLIAVVALTFQALTAAHIPWQAARRGGAATSVVGLLAAFGVGQYLGGIGGGSSTFGVLGGIAILLFFFNLMWIVYVFGAEVTKIYADYLEFGDVVAPHEREESRFKERLDEAQGQPGEPELPENVVRTGIVALVLGFLIGRRRQRP